MKLAVQKIILSYLVMMTQIVVNPTMAIPRSVTEMKISVILTPFFQQNFQKFICHLGRILKLMDFEIGCYLILENY